MIGKKRIGIMAAAGMAVLFAHPLFLAAQQGSGGGRRPATFFDVLSRPKFVTMLVIELPPPVFRWPGSRSRAQ